MAQEAQVAISIAGRLPMREAIPLLREMEACADVSAWGAGTGTSRAGTSALVGSPAGRAGR